MSGIAWNNHPSISHSSLRQVPAEGVSLPISRTNAPDNLINSTPKAMDNRNSDTVARNSTHQRPSTGRSSNPPDRLSEAELKLVQELQQRDLKVRIHEQAHMATAGGYALGGPTYTYQTGPDGRSYAVGGHVKLDTSTESTPEATIQKAQTIRRAALAPSDPSSTDRAVAAAATKMEQTARKELAEKEQARDNGGNSVRYGIDKYMETTDIMNGKNEHGLIVDEPA